jgi:hypothetical protein
MRATVSMLLAALASSALLASLAACSSSEPAAGLTVVVRSPAGHPISPLIYGVADADPAVVHALGATLDRWGGNPSTTYNWVIGHAWNAGRDWGFRNTDYGTPQGSVSDAFVAGALAAGASPLITIPTIGWVARNGDDATQSVDVPAQGGPPLAPGSASIAGYDPASNQERVYEPSFAAKPGPLQDPPDPTAPAVYQDEWVHHLVERFGAAPAGVRFFAMDNEPDLWSVNHTDIHPVEMGYEAMLANYRQYAAAVKAVDPGAQLLGPDVSGWTAYFYSALDQGSDDYATHADSRRHGGGPFLKWWLAEMRRLDAAQHTRLVNYLDVHYYPQAPGVVGNGSDPATRALRIRSTRSLWDPTYRDESWIDATVMLIPRLEHWIAAAYPGTKLAITEYNWGGEEDASGAVALAEVLGIFGQEGVDLASYWTYPPPQSPAGAAFRLYRNYDGRGATFGDVSLPVSAPGPIAAYAARHSGSGELDVVLANTSLGSASRVRVRAGRSLEQTPFCIPPGSGRIVPGPSAAAGTAVVLAPLEVCLIRLEGAGR